MVSLTIQDLDPVVETGLRARAEQHGRSIEAEARVILRAAVDGEGPAAAPNLAEAIRRRFAPVGGVDDLGPHPAVMVGEPPGLHSCSCSIRMSFPS